MVMVVVMVRLLQSSLTLPVMMCILCSMNIASDVEVMEMILHVEQQMPRHET